MPWSRSIEVARTALGALAELGVLRPPVDAIECLSRRAEVVFARLKGDGCTYYHAGMGRYLVILPARLRLSPRLNWTAAHELGHIYLHFGPNSKRPRNSYAREREADWFARNFLMPQEWVRKEARILSPHGEPLLARELGWLKEIFDVSWEALIIRLDELGIQDRRVSEKELGITLERAGTR